MSMRMVPKVLVRGGRVGDRQDSHSRASAVTVRGHLGRGGWRARSGRAGRGVS